LNLRERDARVGIAVAPRVVGESQARSIGRRLNDFLLGRVAQRFGDYEVAMQIFNG
jgi:hypothetical protein